MEQVCLPDLIANQPSFSWEIFFWLMDKMHSENEVYEEAINTQMVSLFSSHYIVQSTFTL